MKKRGKKLHFQMQTHLFANTCAIVDVVFRQVVLWRCGGDSPPPSPTPPMVCFFRRPPFSSGAQDVHV